jgi:hypothetical protein
MVRRENSNSEADQARSRPALIVFEACAFLCELAMLVVLAIGGWGVGSGGLMSIAFAIFYPSLAILIWSIWMAPTAPRRLDDPWRLVAQIVVFAATGSLGAVGGHAVLGVVFAVVAIACFTGTRFTGGATGATSDTHAGSSSS